MNDSISSSPSPTSSSSSTTSVTTSPLWKQFFLSMFSGVHEALSLKRPLQAVLGSTTIRKCFLKCLVLNGMLFLGSILIFEHVVKPLLLSGGETVVSSEFVRELNNDMENTTQTTTSSSSSSFKRILPTILTLFYYVFWIFPWYVLSYIFNASWYGKIANRYSELRRSPLSKSFRKDSSTSSSTSGMIEQFYAGLRQAQTRFADAVYTNFIFLGMGLQCFLFGLIPYIGKPIQFILLCWMYAFYCFDYKWTIGGYSVEQRKQAFVNNWAFFLGFGAPLTLLSTFSPFFVSYGIFALVFPIFIVLAIAAKPITVKSGALGRPPLFELPAFIAKGCVWLVMRGRSRSSTKSN